MPEKIIEFLEEDNYYKVIFTQTREGLGFLYKETIKNKNNWIFDPIPNTYFQRNWLQEIVEFMKELK